MNRKIIDIRMTKARNRANDGLYALTLERTGEHIGWLQYFEPCEGMVFPHWAASIDLWRAQNPVRPHQCFDRDDAIQACYVEYIMTHVFELTVINS